MPENRSIRTRHNLVSGFANKIVLLFLPFLVRTIVIKKLGAEYLGLNSLFSSILQVLSMAELGFSSAVVFSMYKPIAERCIKEVNALLFFYRKVYRIVGFIITVSGIMLLPWLKYIIKGGYPSEINLYILYLLFLANTSVSYFAYAYKNVILIASQRQDILNNIETIISISKSVVQATVLLVWSNYYLYIIWMIVFTIISNIAVSVITKIKYPEYLCKGDISKEKKEDLSKRIRGLAIGKISVVARNSFDSIVLSMFCGLVDVAIYSNYFYVFTSVGGFLNVIVLALTGSVGNSVAIESVEKNYYDNKRFYYVFSGIICCCTACFYCLYQPFMRTWAGEKLTAKHFVMILFCIYFYISQMGQVRALYGNASGLWWEFRKLTIGEMICNLLLNFGLGYYFGMIGILISTIITVTGFSLIGITHILYKKYFKKSSMEYWIESFKYIVITILACIISDILCRCIKLDKWIGLFVKATVCLLCSSLVFAILTLTQNKYRSFMKSVVKNLKA